MSQTVFQMLLSQYMLISEDLLSLFSNIESNVQFRSPTVGSKFRLPIRMFKYASLGELIP